MKLCLVIPNLRAGGGEKVLSNLANHWAGKGHAVFLVTLAPEDESPFYPLHKKVQRLSLNAPLNHQGSFLKTLTLTWKAVRALRKIFRDLKPDLILSFLVGMNLVTLLASRGLGTRVMVSERLDPAFHRLSEIYQKLRLITYPWATKIVVQTQSVANYFPEALQKKIVIIPNGVRNPSKTWVLKKHKTKSLMSVGRLDPQKDHGTLIQAFAKVVEEAPDLTLTIYGEGPDRRSLEALIQSYGLEKKIQLPGVLKSLENVLLSADLFVFPSRYEGFPNALCEAMSMGIPVIASRCSGNVDVVVDQVNGRLFPVGDVPALVSLMRELIKNPDQREALGQEARRITDTFGEDKILKQWDEVVQKIEACP